MAALELKIPPPLVALLFGVVMWIVSSPGGAADVSLGIRVGIAIVVASIGVVFGFSAMASFLRAKTTMSPIKPSATSSLITQGAYRLTRNPMYLSLVLYLVAWAAYLSNWLALLLVPLFVLYIDRFQIKPEERVLSALYGPEYESYKSRVGRWL